MKSSLSVTFANVEFKNPVVTASGTFGFGREYGEYYDLSELGGICVKGLTRFERIGNPPPRIAETPMGMLNSVGLQNPGVEYFIEKELPFLRQYDTKVIANISGESAEQFGEMAALLSDAGVDMIEVNVSCPNVKNGGIQFGTDPGSITQVTKAVKENSAVPVMIKLSPNVTDISEMAKAAEGAGADAISLINTILGMRIDINSRKPLLYNNTGGLSGPAILPVAIRMVWQVKNAVKIPVLGMGGISKADDAIEMLLAGADLIAVGTANFTYPKIPIIIRDGIEEYLSKHDLSSVTELTQGVIVN